MKKVTKFFLKSAIVSLILLLANSASAQTIRVSYLTINGERKAFVKNETNRRVELVLKVKIKYAKGSGISSAEIEKTIELDPREGLEVGDDFELKFSKTNNRVKRKVKKIKVKVKEKKYLN